MSASTETLVNLRGLTGEAKTKANVTVSSIAPRKYKNKYSYCTRVNKINVLNNASFGGNYSFSLPYFSQLVQESWIEMDLPGLTQESTATWRKYPMLH
jgi:hypothetical protein